MSFFVQSSGRSGAVLERRSVCRYPASCYAALFANDDVFAARVDSLSVDGVGLVLNEPVPEDTTGHVKLFTLAGPSCCTRSLRVTHSTPWSDGNYLVGCEFLEELDWEDYQNLVS